MLHLWNFLSMATCVIYLSNRASWKKKTEEGEEKGKHLAVKASAPATWSPGG